MTNREFKIAVLLPTHKRTDALSRSVFSLLDNAHDLSQIQFVFGIDSNDEIGCEHFVNAIQPVLDQRDVTYTALEFEPLGYGALNRYFNTLAEHADADWLFVWCDDAIMSTQAWDQRIIECTGEFKLLKVHTHNEHPYSIFPIMPAEWPELTGYLSKHQLIDAEVSQMAYLLDIMKIIEVDVTHDRHDLTGNNADENAKKKKYFEGNPKNPEDFHNKYVTHNRLVDVGKLAAYMRSKNIDTSHWDAAAAGKIDPWALMKANDPNNQTTQFKLPKT